jgi:hypothetical protein
MLAFETFVHRAQIYAFELLIYTFYAALRSLYLGKKIKFGRNVNANLKTYNEFATI